MHVKEGYFFTPPKQVTSPTWGLPPPCKQALSYTFYGGNVVRVLVHFFFTAAHFHLASVAASISHFVSAANKFSCCSSDEKCLLCFLSLFFFFFFFLTTTTTVALFLVEFRWPTAHFLFFSVFLVLYIPNLWT